MLVYSRDVTGDAVFRLVIVPKLLGLVTAVLLFKEWGGRDAVVREAGSAETAMSEWHSKVC